MADRTLAIRLSLDGMTDFRDQMKAAGLEGTSAFNTINAAIDGTGRGVERLVVRLDPTIRATTSLSDAAGKLASAQAYLSTEMAKGGDAAERTAASLKVVQSASAQVAEIQAALAAKTISATEATQQLRQVMSGTANDSAKAAASFNALKASLDPAYAATQKLTEGRKTLDAALASGLTTEAEHAALLQKMGDGARFGATQTAILQSGVINTFQSIASGLPVGQTLLTQTVQTAPALAGMGVAALAAAAPFIVLGAAVAAMVVAHVQANAELKETNRVLALAGGAAGVTSSQFYELADQAAQSGQITRASALALQQTYAATGKIGGDMLSKLAAETKAWATLTAQSTEDASKQLAGYFSDPSSAATQLAKSLNLLSLQQVQTIQSMDRTGNSAGAQAALFAAIKDRADQAKESLGYFGQALNNIADNWERIKHWGAPDALPPVQRLADVTAQYDAVLKELREDQAKAATDDDYVGAVVADQQKLAALVRQAEDLRRSIASQTRQASAGADQTAANDLGAKVMPIVNALPDAQIKGLNADILALSRAFLTIDPATGKSVISATQYAQAVQAARAQIEGLQQPYQKWLDQQRIEQQVLAADPALRDQLRARLQAEYAARTVNASAIEKGAMAAGAEASVVRARDDAYLRSAAAASASTAATLTVADAYGVSAEAGLRAAEAAKVQDQARTDLTVRTHQQEVVERNLAAASAASYAALAQQVQQLDVATQQQDALAAASAKGAQALADQTIANQAAVMVQKAINDAKAAGITLTQQEIEVKRQEIEVDLKRQALDQQRIAADNELRSANDNITYLQAEIDTLGMDSQARAVLLAQMKAEQQLRANNLALYSSEDAADKEKVRSLIDAAGKTAALTAENERLTAAYQTFSDLGTSTFDAMIQKVVSASDATATWKDMFRGLVAEIETAGIKLAVLNPLKNWLSGDNKLPTLSDLTKVAGNAQGAAGSGSSSGAANDNPLAINTGTGLLKYLDIGGSSSGGTGAAAGSAAQSGGWLSGLGSVNWAGTLGIAGASAAVASTLGNLFGQSDIQQRNSSIFGAFLGGIPGAILGSIFGPSKSVGPVGQIGITQGGLGAGQVVGLGPVGVDNGQSRSDATAYGKSAISAINSAAQTAGVSNLVLSQNSGFLNGNYIETINGTINTFVNGVKKSFTDGDAAIADFAKRLLQDDHSGALSADVKTALANTKATTSAELNSDIAFAKSFRDTLSSYSQGLAAADDVQLQAKASIVSTIQSLQDFKKTTADLGLDTAAANTAASDYLKSLLGITPAAATLDATQQAVAKIDGAVQGAIPYLAEFGISIDDVTAAAKNAKATLLSDYMAKLNDAFLQAGDAAEQAAYAEQQLVAQRATAITDIKALGGSEADVATANTVYARLMQNVVDQAQLSGDAFNELLSLMPDLTGQIHAYSAAVADATDTTAAATAAANLAAANRAAAQAKGQVTYLNATGGTVTGAQDLTASLSGATDLSAIIATIGTDLDNITALGKAGVDSTDAYRGAFDRLNAALTAGTIAPADYTTALGVLTSRFQTAQQSVSSLAATASQLTSAGASVQAYIDKAKSGGVTSYLSPTDQLSNARDAFNRQLALAQANDSTALGGITQYADTYLSALTKTQGSGTDTTATINAVLAQLSALPATQSFNDKNLALLGQIAANTNNAAASLARADANGDKVITWAEFQSWGTGNTASLKAIGALLNLPGGGDLASIFAAIDTNGDGTISQLESTRVSLLSALTGLPSPTALQVGGALAPYFGALTSSTNGRLDLATFTAVMSGKADNGTLQYWFGQLDSNGDGAISQLEVTRAQLLDGLSGIATPTALQVGGALAPYFQQLAAIGNGRLDLPTFTAVMAGKADNGTLSYWFAQLDNNGDGAISQLEVTRAQLLSGLSGIASPTAQQVGGALKPYFDDLTASTNGLLSQATFKSVLSGKADDSTLTTWFKQLDANGDGQLSKLETLNSSTGDVTSAVGDLAGSGANGTLADIAVIIATGFKIVKDTIDATNILIYNADVWQRAKWGDEWPRLDGLRDVLDAINVYSGKVTWNTAQTAAKLGGTPAYATGTDYHPGGLAIVGERGPEVAWLPTGTRVWPNGSAPSFGGGSVNTAGVEARLDTIIRQNNQLLAQIRAGGLASVGGLGRVETAIKSTANAVRGPVGGLTTIQRRAG
ncbi:phage tail length tape measure family protein [Nitrospirillum iridis]|uniref:Ca2+-binding EF-hand superfamily protein n=1 Tax=Nitrospirillum iridis TaxID=765888 RepID=A0A7X0EC83_9PROT|nr:phage tail length tape measure family protein [Nitrospirillum iridis]MBB6251442.1 Ca2+-binding EF-hand superfamily protein [Nitrospirillum iridis]